VGSPFCRVGGGRPQGEPLSPHTLSAPTVSPLIIIFLASHEACGVAGWSVRKLYWVIREAC
jgi:hypothetical protein